VKGAATNPASRSATKVVKSDPEMDPRHEELARLFAGNPMSETFGNASKCAEALGVTNATASRWLNLPATRRRVAAHMDARADDVRRVRSMLEAAGVQAAIRLVEAINAMPTLHLWTAADYIAFEKGCDPEEVTLPEAGSLKWSRIEQAVAKHNSNHISIYKDVLSRATTLIAHAVGNPARKSEHVIKDDRDDTELGERIRTMTPTEQQNLLTLLDDLHGLLSTGELERLDTDDDYD